jgi:hypothetical protein
MGNKAGTRKARLRILQARFAAIAVMVRAQQETLAMKPAAILALAAALSLAGCSGGGNADADGDGKVTLGEAAKQAKDEGLKPQPGLYKTTVTMTELKIPGLPPEMEGHGAGLTNTVEDCLTAEEVGKGFEDMVRQGQNGDCAYESFALSGGKLDAVMVCKADGRETRTSMTGTASATGADLTATTQMSFDGAGKGTMTATVKHERIGECKAQSGAK